MIIEIIVLEIITEAGNRTPWYNTTFGGAVIGGVISAIIFIFTIYLNHKIKQNEERKNFLILISQNYSELFKLIFQMSVDPQRVDLLEFWNALKNNYFVYLLPPNLKKLFIKLYNIRKLGSDNYSLTDISGVCKEIISKIEEYGVNTFDY